MSTNDSGDEFGVIIFTLSLLPDIAVAVILRLFYLFVLFISQIARFLSFFFKNVVEMPLIFFLINKLSNLTFVNSPLVGI